RLTAQVGNKDTAIEILKKRGHLDKNGEYTVEGLKRSRMTAEERAKDRASKKTGKPKSAFNYNPKTNMAKLKG
ncbi:hypothetical protein N9F47_05055, partial [Gammaproteobacteria bacterium]|nr:hypothetical protein [Gammaproteobacteria bacterium]